MRAARKAREGLIGAGVVGGFVGILVAIAASYAAGLGIFCIGGAVVGLGVGS